MDPTEEQLISHKKNLDILGDKSGNLSNDDEAEDAVFTFDYKNETCNMNSILRMLHLKINSIAQEILTVKKFAAR